MESRKERNARARIANALWLYWTTCMRWQWIRAFLLQGEAYLRRVVLGQGEMEFSDHEKRKQKNSKLKQIITPLRSGRTGYMVLLFAAVGMLVFVSQDRSPHHTEEFERALLTAANKARAEVALNRKLKLAGEASHLDTESEPVLKVSEDRREVLRAILGSEVRSTGADSDDGGVEQEVGGEKLEGLPDESAQVSSLRRRAAAGTLRVGLLNLDPKTDIGNWNFLLGEQPVVVPMKRVSKSVGWLDLFPEWIDEAAKYGTPKCPVFPMPAIPSVPYVSPTVKLDVVVASAPCGEPSTLQETWKHPAILQVLLGAANLAAETGHVKRIHVLILSKCRPLVNLFPCRELVERRDDGWLYHMDIAHLKKRTSLPVGSCQLSVHLSSKFYVPDHASDQKALNSPREAYATILHSGGGYVCGAIALAHSIRSTGTTRALVALVDGSLSSQHRQGLVDAGWTVQEYERITSPSALGNPKDFSMVRLWQLDYEKVIYLESDMIVLRNMDHLFQLPEVAASGTTQSVFDAGLMVLEPSNCTFQVLMDEMEKLAAKVVDDWDFFNRVFFWWHRIPRHMNALKYFWSRDSKVVDAMSRLFAADPPELYAIHYVRGQKPWNCFRDYDCNWNTNLNYASNEAHAQWFKVYDQMAPDLQEYCALSSKAKADLEHDRRSAQSNDMPEKYWATLITDSRLNVCQENYCDLKLCEQNHCDWNAMLRSANLAVNASVTVPASNTTSTVAAAAQ